MEWLLLNVATRILIHTLKFRTTSKTLPPLGIFTSQNPWHLFARPSLRNTAVDSCSFSNDLRFRITHGGNLVPSVNTTVTHIFCNLMFQSPHILLHHQQYNRTACHNTLVFHWHLLFGSITCFWQAIGFSSKCAVNFWRSKLLNEEKTHFSTWYPHIPTHADLEMMPCDVALFGKFLYFIVYCLTSHRHSNLLSSSV